MRNGYIYILAPLLICILLAYGILYGGINMNIAGWISIVVAIIGVVGALLASLLQLKRDGKTIDKLDGRAEQLPAIAENAKKSVSVLAEQLKPQVDQISERNKKIDFIAGELEYQKRLNERVSSGVDSRDAILESIKKLYEENARLSAALQSEKEKNYALSIENEKLKSSFAKYKKDSGFDFD